MSFLSDELSIDRAQPIECYGFLYKDAVYTYTSAQYPIMLNISGVSYIFNPEYIKRGDSLKLGDSSGSVETCTITVSRTNSVALLYQGAPPEFDTVKVYVFRVHGENNNEYSTLIYGTVSQVTFRDSEAELTITIENILNRYIPRGTLSYYCQNCIYDEKCRLNKDDWSLVCYVDGGFSGLWIYSTNLLEKPSGYFTDGCMQMGNCFRSIKVHQDRGILLKYPLAPSQKQGSFTVYPGCNALFKNCAEKFRNTDNFSGVPYIEPYDPFTHPVDKGAYWEDSDVIVRDSRGKIYEPSF